MGDKVRGLEVNDNKITERVQHLAEQIAENREQHIEEFAAAYLKKTCLDPEDAVLVEQRWGMQVGWYFISRKEWENEKGV